MVWVSKHSCFKACKDSHLQRHTNIYSHHQVLLIQSPRQLDQVMLTYIVCYVLLMAWLPILPPRCVCYSASKHVCWLMTLRFALLYLHHWSSLILLVEPVNICQNITVFMSPNMYPVIFPNYSNGNQTMSSTWVSSKIKQRRAVVKVAEGSSCAAGFSLVVWASHCSFMEDIFEI